MRDINNDRWENVIEYSIPTSEELEQVARVLCERALNDAKSQLHPLLRYVELSRLDYRAEFLLAFKGALEKRSARKLAVWLPNVQAIFQFDETRVANMECWDGSIHLLVKISRLSNAVDVLGKQLNSGLVRYLTQVGWQRFRACRPVLDVQQVTISELRHAVGYGAMFCAVYTAPVQVWPQDRQVR